MQCEVVYDAGHNIRWRCARDAVERITIAVGPVEQATKGSLDADSEVHVLHDPLENTHRPEMN